MGAGAKQNAKLWRPGDESVGEVDMQTTALPIRLEALTVCYFEQVYQACMAQVRAFNHANPLLQVAEQCAEQADQLAGHVARHAEGAGYDACTPLLLGAAKQLHAILAEYGAVLQATDQIAPTLADVEDLINQIHTSAAIQAVTRHAQAPCIDLPVTTPEAQGTALPQARIDTTPSRAASPLRAASPP